MRRLKSIMVICLIPVIFILLFFNCKKKSDTEPPDTEVPKNLYGKVPNPASVYCQDMGYKSELREDTSGNQYEVCILPDESECRSWDLLKGKCGQKFTICEKQGNRIETRVLDMGTWKMEYAVCVFPDGSERPEWELFQEKVKTEQEE